MIRVKDTHTGKTVTVPGAYWAHYNKANKTYPTPRYVKVYK